MSRIEYLTPEGYRQDGRRTGTSRKMAASFIQTSNVSGCAIFECGNTRVMAEISGPDELAASKRDGVSDEALITVNVMQPPFAAPTRQPMMRNDSKMNDIAAYVLNVFNGLIVRHKYPQTEINIMITVQSNDGSLTACCTNAVFLALVRANIQLKETIGAISVGMLNDDILVDLNFNESGGISEMNVTVGEATGHIYGLNHFHRATVENHTAMIEASVEQIKKVYGVMRSALMN